MYICVVAGFDASLGQSGFISYNLETHTHTRPSDTYFFFYLNLIKVSSQITYLFFIELAEP